MAIADNTTALRNLLNVANALPEAGGPVYGNAVFFGDSITQGVGNNDYSYVDVLAESGAFESVKKHGVGGACIHPESNTSLSDYALINQINRYASDVQNADIVFIEYGGNDMFRTAEGTSYVMPGLATDSASDNTVCGYALRAINRVKELAPSARLVWMQFASWRPNMYMIAQMPEVVYDLMLYQEASLYRLARNNGCTIINLSDSMVFGDEIYFVEDGIHPNTIGHQRLAETLLANMNGNSVEQNLYRVYTVAADSIEDLFTATPDGTWASAYAFLMAGGVDISLNLILAGVFYTHLKPIAFTDNLIAFGTITGDEASSRLLSVLWMVDGSIAYQESDVGSSTPSTPTTGNGTWSNAYVQSSEYNKCQYAKSGNVVSVEVQIAMNENATSTWTNLLVATGLPKALLPTNGMAFFQGYTQFLQLYVDTNGQLYVYAMDNPAGKTVRGQMVYIASE